MRCLLALCLGAACAHAEDRPLRFVPQWIPQAQFAGYYVAAEKGIYEAHGVRVEILEGGPALPPSKAIADGRADCGTFFLANGIVDYEKGLPIVNVAQIVQKSAQMLITRASSGIKSPADMDGKKVGLWGDEFQVQPRALFRKFGVKPRIVPQAVTVNLFLKGGVDVVSAMWHNEYHSLLNTGIEPGELRLFFFDQYGLNFPEDGIYCSKTFLESRTAEVEAFVRASLEGWAYAFAHEEEALDIVMAKAQTLNQGTNRAHQRWMLERMRDIIHPPGAPEPGTLVREDFNRVVDELLTSDFIATRPAWEEFYHSCIR